LSKLKCVVVGVGHLGKHHARILASMPDTSLAAVVDPSRERGGQIAAEYSASHVTDVAELGGSADAVVIAAPTNEHFRLASFFIERGVPVLVEKPMTATLAEAQALVELAARKHVPLQVGHVERFNPAMLAVRKHLKQPAYIECDRIAPFGFRSMDTGVVMDLMIHDLDMVIHLAGSEIAQIDAIGVPVISKSEDVANARIRFAGGCIANLTASRVAVSKQRKMRIFQADAYFSLDYEARKAKIYRKAADFVPPENVDLANVDDPMALVFGKMLITEDVEMGSQEPLRSELESFVRCVQTGSAPEVGGQDGLKAIAAATEIVRQIQNHTWGRP